MTLLPGYAVAQYIYMFMSLCVLVNASASCMYRICLRAAPCVVYTTGYWYTIINLVPPTVYPTTCETHRRRACMYTPPIVRPSGRAVINRAKCVFAGRPTDTHEAAARVFHGSREVLMSNNIQNRSNASFEVWFEIEPLFWKKKK